MQDTLRLGCSCGCGGCIRTINRKGAGVRYQAAVRLASLQGGNSLNPIEVRLATGSVLAFCETEFRNGTGRVARLPSLLGGAPVQHRFLALQPGYAPPPPAGERRAETS